MGCFNIGCLVSGRAIQMNDEIVSIAIKQSQGVGDCNPCENECSPTTRFIPISFPVEGLYNDYGSIETDGLDESQFGVAVINTIFDEGFSKIVETAHDSKFKPKLGYASAESSNGMYVGFTHILKSEYDRIMGMMDPVVREREINDTIYLMQQGLYARVAVYHAHTGKGLPEQLQSNPYVAHYYRDAVKAEAAKDDGDHSEAIRQYQLSSMSTFEFPYDGFTDPLTGQHYSSPSFGHSLRHTRETIWPMVSMAITLTFSRIPKDGVVDALNNKRIRDYISAMCDMNHLVQYLGTIGVQIIPPIVTGQGNNISTITTAKLGTISDCWDKLVGDVDEGYFDVEEAAVEMNAEIEKVKNLLQKMEAGRDMHIVAMSKARS
jgi:hypothetical protein